MNNQISESTMSFFEKGVQSFQQGQYRHQNPYADVRGAWEAYADWHTGWDAAFADKVRNN